jgi:hypothetical protein
MPVSGQVGQWHFAILHGFGCECIPHLQRQRTIDDAGDEFRVPVRLDPETPPGFHVILVEHPQLAKSQRSRMRTGERKSLSALEPAMFGAAQTFGTDGQVHGQLPSRAIDEVVMPLLSGLALET